MTTAFNESLGHILTDCRNNALEDLKGNKQYSEAVDERREIRSGLEASISPEAQKLLESLFEADLVIQSMEYSRILLCGLTLSEELKKRFDAATPEYMAFEKEYVQ